MPLAFIVGCSLSLCTAVAESPPAKQQAPELRVHVVGRQDMGEARGFSLAIEVSNPGTQSLWYHGYRPDSFDPPIPKGQMRPMYRVELKQDGKWRQHPIGWCGTGMDELELAPKASATFGVSVPAGPWEAVRIGLLWHPRGARGDSPPTVAWTPEFTRREIGRGVPPLSAIPIAHDPRRPTTFYTLEHADGDQAVALLRSLFIVVDPAHPYATFEFEEAQPVESLVVTASPEHQAQIARVLALVDSPQGPPATDAVEGSAANRLVAADPIRHTDGNAAAAVLGSLFLVVNHQVAYARFGYDARTRSLIAIASGEHQKQIAKVIEVLDVKSPDQDGAKAIGGEPLLCFYTVRHADGEQLVGRLRSQFVVVNHEKAEARFAFDARTSRLIVIAAEKLQSKVSATIAALDEPPRVRHNPGDKTGTQSEKTGTQVPVLPTRSGGPPPVALITSAGSRKNCGPIAAGVIAHSARASLVR